MTKDKIAAEAQQVSEAIAHCGGKPMAKFYAGAVHTHMICDACGYRQPIAPAPSHHSGDADSSRDHKKELSNALGIQPATPGGITFAWEYLIKLVRQQRENLEAINNPEGGDA